ncbi:MAG: hypothetical protein Kow0069_14560 [Promethearchaeota archaeon]
MLETLRPVLPGICGEFNLDFALLGGSWAFGRQRWWSDVDVFVSRPTLAGENPRPDFDALLDLNAAVGEASGLAAVSVSILEALPLHVQFEAFRGGMLLFERTPGSRAKYLERLMNHYYDHVVWYRRYLDESMKSMLSSRCAS